MGELAKAHKCKIARNFDPTPKVCQRGQTYQVGWVLVIRFFGHPCRARQDRCGERVMDATLVLIDSDAELLRARALVDQLWHSNDPAGVARLEAQARLIAAYEEMKGPRRPPNVADLIRHLMDQHGLTRADLIPLLGTPSRVSEVMRGKKGLSMAMVQRLRARFRVPADLLLPPPKKSPPRRSPKRAAPRWSTAWMQGGTRQSLFRST